jgi:hypothetical protein
MSARTVPSDQDIPEPSEQVLVRSNKRRNAVFMGASEHEQLMKVMEEEDCAIFALSTAHSISQASSNPSSLADIDSPEDPS